MQVDKLSESYPSVVYPAKLNDAIAALTSRGFASRVVPHDPQRRAAPVVKTILFKDKAGIVFGAAVPLSSRVSYKALRALRESRVSTLHPEEMRELGWLPGECCPLTTPGILYVDPAVLTHDAIESGSGSVDHGLVYDPQAILAVRDDVTVVDVAK